jgi:hypothetical protein
VISESRPPWKKHFRSVPTAVRLKVSALGTHPLIIATTKQVSAAAIQRGDYDHLSVALGPNGVLYKPLVTPPADVGRYSAWNVMGREIVRKDLPMITKTFFMEAPDYGDWSRGSHTVVHDRLVYQREIREPRDLPISIELLKESQDPHTVYLMKFAVDCVLDTDDLDFESDLFFCLNLLQENVGSVDIYPSETTRAEFIRTLTLNWEIFPPGSVEEIVGRLRQKMRRADASTDSVIRDRIETFAKLKPRAYVRGTNGFNSYIGALFADDLVVFENVRYGNALYILYEDWESVSRRSRIDLIRGTDADFDRIVHNSVWKEHFDKIIRDELRKRAGR